MQRLNGQKNKASKFSYYCRNGWYEGTDNADDDGDGRNLDALLG